MTKWYLFANFGRGDARNGQVQKALALRTLFSDRYGSEFIPVDVSRTSLGLLRLPGVFRPGNSLCVSLGRNGVRLFALIFLFLRALHGPRRTPHAFYFVVGGWLAGLARSSALVRKFLRSSSGVFVETIGLARELQVMGVNARVFPNFRLNVLANPKREPAAELKLCFCARIREDKGALLALDLAERLKELGQPVSIDFYGPIEPSFQEAFTARLSRGMGRYAGTYDSEEEAIGIISKYDFLVLPTSYPGECMPGAVVEAFCAGTPAIVSDWRFMSEIVDHGRNGLVIALERFATDAAQGIVEIVRKGLYAEFSRNSLEKASRDYSYRAATAILDAVTCQSR